jgi:selenide,water dikinase
VRVAPAVPAEDAALVYDPQTSGGLLVSLPFTRAESMVTSLHKAGVKEAALIGEVVEAEGRPTMDIIP